MTASTGMGERHQPSQCFDCQFAASNAVFGWVTKPSCSAGAVELAYTGHDDLEEPVEDVAPPSRKRPRDTDPMHSYEIFQEFMTVDAETGKVDASAVLSADCFEFWLRTRRRRIKNQHESFRRALISHLTGQDSRRPFDPQVEQAVLRLVRQNRIWECFQDKVDAAGRPVQVGLYGFRGFGYWEQQAVIDRTRR